MEEGVSSLCCEHVFLQANSSLQLDRQAPFLSIVLWSELFNLTWVLRIENRVPKVILCSTVLFFGGFNYWVWKFLGFFLISFLEFISKYSCLYGFMSLPYISLEVAISEIELLEMLSVHIITGTNWITTWLVGVDRNLQISIERF